MHEQFSYVQILMAQNRFAEAERILKDMLTADPNDVDVLAFFAEVNLQQDKNDIAKQTIDTAIGLAPSDPRLFYIKARVCIQEIEFDIAEWNIRHAISLDPEDANFFALLAHIRLVRKNYEEALQYADKALELDPENILALNTRSTTLVKLDRKEEAFDTIEGSLREDPNNPYTHANYGWGLLEKGDHKKALKHFTEALKNDPTNDYAQAGMMEALKARYFIYRWFLKYAFWIGNLTSKNQWAVIIGFYLGTRVLSWLADHNKTLQPYLTPLVLALAVIAFSTWVIRPISNLFLRLNPYGKFLLSDKEKMSSNFVGLSFLLFASGFLMYFLLRHDGYLAMGMFGFAMMLPYSVMFNRTKYKNALLYYALGMTAAGVGAVVLTFMSGDLFNGMTTVFAISFFAFQWVANFMMIDAHDH